jgi:hypothetical protein
VAPGGSVTLCADSMTSATTLSPERASSGNSVCTLWRCELIQRRELPSAWPDYVTTEGHGNSVTDSSLDHAYTTTQGAESPSPLPCGSTQVVATWLAMRFAVARVGREMEVT